MIYSVFSIFTRVPFVIALSPFVWKISKQVFIKSRRKTEHNNESDLDNQKKEYYILAKVLLFYGVNDLGF